MNGTEGAIVTWALAASTVAKAAVDLVRMGKPDLARWVPPVLAVLVGIGAVALLMVAAGLGFAPDRAAIAVLAGILAGGSAVGVTELSKRAETPQE